MSRKIKNKNNEEIQNPLTDSHSNDKCGDDVRNPAVVNWQKDIEKHDYYYDDAHGYQVFDPDEDDKEEDEN